jgi:hypothetical protein
VLFALNILLHLEQAANACLPPVDTTHPTNERPASRRQARQGPRARSVRGISRQDWEGSRARPASHRPKPWVPARIGAHRHGDRGREGEVGTRGRRRRQHARRALAPHGPQRRLLRRRAPPLRRRPPPLLIGYASVCPRRFVPTELLFLVPREGRCFMVLLSCSGQRGGVDGVDREGPLVRLCAGEGERRAPLLRFEPRSGEDLALLSRSLIGRSLCFLFSMRHFVAMKHDDKN